MGIIIILSVLCAIPIILTVIGVKHWNWDYTCISTITLAVVLGISVIICSIVCICTQASKPTTLYELCQERESLVESYNTYYNNYDKDLAHSQSLKEIRAEIAEFNAKINKNNYFCDNFFVNWFYIDCTEIEPISITNGTAD
jgi:hypothetical protein